MINSAKTVIHTTEPMMLFGLKIKAIKIPVMLKAPNMVTYGNPVTWKVGFFGYCLRSFSCAQQIPIQMMDRKTWD